MTAYLVAIGSLVLIYGFLAMGLNLHFGVTGLINFGHVAFFAVGAYTAAILNLNGWAFPFTIVAAAIAGGILAYPVGFATLRLRADYLAIVTLALSEVVRVVAINEEWLTRGPDGLSGITSAFPGLPLGTRELVYFLVIAALLLVTFLLLERILRSPFGRVLEAIREDEDAVTALGRRVVGFKLRSLILGAGLAGVAGGLYAHYMRFIVPEQFIPLVTFYVWIAIIAGGAGSNIGSLVGTLFLITFMEGTRFIGDFIPAIDAGQMAAIRFIIIGVGLILLLRFRPQGIMGRKVV